MSDPFERVRQSTRQVVEAARLVRWNFDQLRAVTDAYDPAQIVQAHTFDSPYHWQGEGELQLNYVFVTEALNFGSGLSPAWKRLEDARLVGGSLYKTVADTTRRAIEAGQNLDPTWAARLTPPQLATLFGLPPEFELVALFTNSLNELGRWVVERYGGRYSRLLEAHPTAAALVEEIVTNLSHFRDQAVYEDQPVYFYKRAQILVNDLYLAFGGDSYGAFPDITRLTMFADNLLPHYFRMVGVLDYDPTLADEIERGEPIKAGSPAEIEMRSFAVQCVEWACHRLNERYPSQPIYPAQLDNYLWNYSQSPQIKSRPRHRTITYFY